MVKLGQKIDERFEVLELLGSGGMGTVYKVRHRHLQTVHALKELTCAADGATDQFQLEARILAQLQDPGLPRVVDFFSQRKHHYLVMDYISGQDLHEILLQQGGPLAEKQVLDWMRQLLEILHYIHTQGIVHRDIKPANLKLREDGRLLLVDFGIAKQQRSAQVNQPTSFGAKGAFTPFLAAPEQISGQGTDARSDLYALAATASYLLSNTLPPPLHLSQVNPAVSEATERWLQKGLATLPAQRYPSAQAMLQACSVAPAPPMPRWDIRRR